MKKIIAGTIIRHSFISWYHYKSIFLNKLTLMYLKFESNITNSIVKTKQFSSIKLLKNVNTLGLLLLVLLTHCTPKGQKNYTSEYNLDFDLSKTKQNTWMLDQFYPAEVKQDSSQTVHNKIPFCLYQRMLLSRPMKLQGRLHQNILLPDVKCDSITLYITTKSKNLKIAKLFITRMNKQETILSKDSLSINGTEEWQTFSTTISGQNVKLLNIEIKAEGFNKFNEQKLYLDAIDIKIDGKNINEFPLSVPLSLPLLNKKDISSLSFSDKESYSKIKWLKNKKILAIGESVHGSKSIKKVVTQLIKEKITFENYKLILVELPMEYTLAINSYIHGNTIPNIDDAFESYQPNLLFSKLDLKELVVWLKNYNEKHTNKVSFIGVDMNLLSGLSFWPIREYFFRLQKNNYTPTLDSLLTKLTNYNTLPETISILEKNKILKSTFPKNEYEIVLHFCKMLLKFENDKITPKYHLRDKYMFENTQFLINLLCKKNQKTIVHAHFGHTNPVNKSSKDLSHHSFG